MEKMPCFCGHDCGRCVTRLATVRGDEHLRIRAQAFYQDTFGIALSLAQLYCQGGRSRAVFSLARDCPFAACCRARRLWACRDCAEYPCTMLAEYQKKYVNSCNQIPPPRPEGT